MAEFRFPKRVAGIRSAVEQLELDGILISNNHNRRYLSGFIGSAGYLLITQSQAILTTDFRYTEQAELQATGFEISRIQGRMSEWFPALLKDLEISKLGFEADDMTVASLRMFKDVAKEADVKTKFKPTEGKTAELRAVKDAEELALLQEAINIGDAAFEETFEKMTPGMTEKEVAWEFEKSIREHGAESLSFDTIVAAGPNAARPHHQTGNRKIREGETIVFDCGATYEGYCSDLTRTVVLGTHNDEISRVYNIVLEAQETAIDKVTEGMTGNQADAIAREIIKNAGHGDQFGHSLGHGLGMQVHEKPHVGPRADEKLVNGMPFTIEPGIYIPGWGGVRIEDVVVLENGKARVMSHAPKMSF